VGRLDERLCMLDMCAHGPSSSFWIARFDLCQYVAMVCQAFFDGTRCTK
jgi:hypothetical protein